jgi:hypothetical protein
MSASPKSCKANAKTIVVGLQLGLFLSRRLGHNHLGLQRNGSGGNKLTIIDADLSGMEATGFPKEEMKVSFLAILLANSSFAKM